MTRWARWAANLTLWAVLFAATGELVVRTLNPDPRVQIIRATQSPLRLVEGEPIWEGHDSAPRQNEGCVAPGTENVLVLGSSVFFGTGLDADEIFTAHLQRAAPPGRCYLNFAQPGTSARTKLAWARDTLSRVDVELVLFEVWGNDPGRYVLLGDDAYNLAHLQLRDDGYPRWPPLPGPLHRAAFHSSRFYEYTAVTLTPTRGRRFLWKDLVADVMVPLVDLVAEHGATLVLVPVPSLDRPFAEWADNPSLELAPARDLAAQRDITLIDLAQALRDEDVRALRADTCCHYNADGHEVIATRLGPLLEGTLSDSRGDAP